MIKDTFYFNRDFRRAGGAALLIWLSSCSINNSLAETSAETKPKAKVQISASNGILVDKKITEAEKEHYKNAMKESDKYSSQQAKVINQIPGVNVTAKDLQESEVKKGASLNPIAWLFKPVTRLQEQSVRLEQQIMKLTGPISALQPGMLKLDNRIISVGNQITSVKTQIGNVEGKIEGVGTQMSAMQKDIAAMRAELGEIKKPVVDLKGPIMRLHDPLTKIEKPISGVDARLVLLDKELSDLKMLLSLVLTAIFVSAAMIAIGTPVAAILIWRNKAKLLPKPTTQEIKADESLAQAGNRL